MDVIVGSALLLCVGCAGGPPHDNVAVDAAVPIDFAVADLTPFDQGPAPADDASSNIYPAPHTPLPQVKCQSGSVLSQPRLTSITFAGDPYAADLDTLLVDFTTSNYWSTTTAEYGIGAPTVTPPMHLQETAPNMIDDAYIQNWLEMNLNQSHPDFPQPDENAIYVLFYPAGTTVTLNSLISCQGFAAYHGWTEVDGTPTAYAVVPRCTGLNGLSDLATATSSTSHELVEAATDPSPHQQPCYVSTDSPSWDLIGGGEVADLCTFQVPSAIQLDQTPYFAQRIWSNAAAAASHDPCVPAQAGAYFNSAPRITQSTDYYGSPMPAVLMHQGDEATVELDLFSDRPTPGWHLSAEQVYPPGTDLAFDFSAPTGNNGDLISLKVKALSEPMPFVFYIWSARDGVANFWPVVVASQ
jgi:hypothetical protein